MDLNDPIPGHFTLDVSSPGLERKLRTAKHFASAVGQIVTLRQLRAGESTRRLEGILTDASGNSVTIDDAEAGPVTIELENIERARTVFHWGAEAKPSPSKAASTTKKKG